MGAGKGAHTLGMKLLFEHCRLPLSGAERFCVEDGRFAAPLPPFDARRDLEGAFVLPAFLDAHSHILAYALSLLQAEGGNCRTAQDFIAAAQAFAHEHRLNKDALLTVKNAQTLPAPEALDAFPRPLHIQMRSGHAGMFNAAARALLGLPAQGGILEEGDYLAATKRVPMPAPEAVESAFGRAQADYLAHGMTVAQEGFLTREMFPVYDMLHERGALAMDIVAYPSPDDYDEACAHFSGAAPLRIGGMKIFLDGSPQQKTAYLREPYRGGGRGVLTMNEREVDEACRFAAARGAQLLAHCNGDGAAQLFLAALARLTPAQRRAVRPVLVHGQILGEDQLDAMKRLGVIPSFFPAHVKYWGDVHLKNLGRARAERISPARSALERGIPFTLHQDTPVCPPDPLEAAVCAVLRETRTGETFGAQAIGAADALTALTKNAAMQYADADMGCIKAGMRADFVVLEGNPFHDIRATHVRETWMRGACVYKKET